MLNKRGRPEFTDRSTIKSKAMTVVLTDDTITKLDLMAKLQKRKKATMARLMIEHAIESSLTNQDGMSKLSVMVEMVFSTCYFYLNYPLPTMAEDFLTPNIY